MTDAENNNDNPDFTAQEHPAPGEHVTPPPPSPPTQEAKPESKEDLGADLLKTFQAQLDQAKDQMLRAMADAENARKRAAKEREDASKYAISGFARDLLDVADNLRRALEAVPPDALQVDPRLKGLIEGIEATERGLLSIFQKNGVKKIHPLDEPFNPNFHEVMFETPGTGKPRGTVVLVVEPGYTLNDRLLRPARVGIAKEDGSNGGVTSPGGQIDTKA